ncbi:SWIM zinc finger family protein [Salinibacter altiplanensis]|uniref:SWIM zinc finger family protein n=1 Tax=Salinibacter altiplanensis TaxID=1803181 RepID=UPI0012FFF723|nr:SWIM zinc finger family protein [Salinibacter altiplanensis]
MPDLPALSRGDVRNWTEQRFFDRGDTYFRHDRIQHPRRVGHILKAECRGSQPQPYHIEATLDTAGISDAECSCPMGGGGYCKHVVALLPTWVESAEAFSTQASLGKTLRQRPKGELVDLLLRMIDRHPDLERLVTASAQANAPLDPAPLRGDIKAAFQAAAPSHEHDTDPRTKAVDDIQPYLSLGDNLAAQGRRDDAATVYRLLTDVGCEHYPNLPESSGHLASFVQTCTERLGDALADVDALDLREDILRTLFEAYVTDLAPDGDGLGDAAKQILLDASRPPERRQISKWVRARLPGMDGSTDGRRVIVLGSSDASPQAWKRKALGGFLLDLRADSLDEETALQIYRDTGRTEDLVGRLLSGGRREKALDAEAVEASHPEAALDIYKERVKVLCDRADPDRWSDVLGALYDEELHRLPAARDEFEQAGLL